MENLTGFIVSVRPKHGQSVNYECDGNSHTLAADDEFVGYYWQITDVALSVPLAHIQEVSLVDTERKQFAYGKRVRFPLPDIAVSIRALRGDVSYTGSMVKLDQIERWFPINSR